MPQSISIREAQQFNIPEGTTEILKSGISIGSIRTTSQSVDIEGVIFKKYIGKFTKNVKDDILIFDFNADEWLPINQYQKAFEFNIFHSDSKKLLLLSSTTSITKKFLKELQKVENVTLEYGTPKFDLTSVSNLMPKTKGIRFNSEDMGVNNKSFTGDEVDANDEAALALENDNATQIMGNLDILGNSRTILLSKTGSLVSYTSLVDLRHREYPMLEFTLAALRELNIIK